MKPIETKTEIIDFALSELLRQRAVKRAIASLGRHPDLPTHEGLEKTKFHE